MAGSAVTDSTGAWRLHFAQFAGYGAGDAANNLTFSMASAFLLIYYTNVAGIPAASRDLVPRRARPRRRHRPHRRADRRSEHHQMGQVPPLRALRVGPAPRAARRRVLHPPRHLLRREARVGVCLLRPVPGRVPHRQHPLRIARRHHDPTARRARPPVDGTNDFRHPPDAPPQPAAGSPVCVQSGPLHRRLWRPDRWDLLRTGRARRHEHLHRYDRRTDRRHETTVSQTGPTADLTRSARPSRCSVQTPLGARPTPRAIVISRRLIRSRR